MTREFSPPSRPSLVGWVLLLSACTLLASPCCAQQVTAEISMIFESFTSLPDQADVVSPFLKADEPISYPEEAAKNGVQGTVRLKILVAADGSVSQSEVIDNGGDPRLLRAAVEGLRRTGFTPGTINGLPTEMWIVAEVVFTGGEADSPKKEEDDDSAARNYGVTGGSGDYILSSSDWGSEEPIYDPDDIPPLLHYPDLARQYGLEGEVTIYAEIDTDGSVLQVEVLESSSTLFEESALEAVKKLEFLPGMENGSAAKMWQRVVVEFRLPDEEKEEIMLEAGMDDFIPDATLPAYNREELLTLLEQESPEPIAGHKIVLSVRVDTDGKVLRSVVRSTTTKWLEEPAINAVKKLTFTPGMQNGRPVALWVTIPLDMSTTGTPNTTEITEEKKP